MREETLSGCPVIRMGDAHKEVLSRLQFAAGIFLMRIPSDFYGLMVFLFLEQREVLIYAALRPSPPAYTKSAYLYTLNHMPINIQRGFTSGTEHYIINAKC